MAYASFIISSSFSFVGAGIRHRADLQRCEEVSLPTAYLAAWGINKDAKRRAIAALEQAKLI